MTPTPAPSTATPTASPTVATPPAATHSADFRLLEFECLRKEVELQITALRQAEDYCLLAVGVVWAWLFGAQLAATPAAFLPGVIAAVFYLKRLSIEANIEAFHGYLRDKVEKGFGVEGWEHYIDKQSDVMRKWSHLYYAVIIAASLGAATAFVAGWIPAPVVPAGK